MNETFPTSQGPARPIPQHIAVIMDGNGRWAKARGMPRVAGHRKGVDAVRACVETSVEIGIKYLTLFSFSSENWRRSADEVGDLMGLLRRYLKSEMADLHSKNIRFRVIGDRSALAPDIVRLIEDAENMTDSNQGLTLILALSYGGRAEIARAARKIARAVELGLLKPDAIDEDQFSGFLDTAGIPDPDLLIRTSGEQRISNFLLWQCAYTEFLFVDTLWPDFRADDLRRAIDDFGTRDRRFGATVSSA